MHWSFVVISGLHEPRDRRCFGPLTWCNSPTEGSGSGYYNTWSFHHSPCQFAHPSAKACEPSRAHCWEGKCPHLLSSDSQYLEFIVRILHLGRSMCKPKWAPPPHVSVNHSEGVGAQPGWESLGRGRMGEEGEEMFWRWYAITSLWLSYTLFHHGHNYGKEQPRPNMLSNMDSTIIDIFQLQLLLITNNF